MLLFSRWAHPLVRPELGCLVLANESMFTQRQQYFYHAVILVIQHGLDGTVGLILNRPTTFTMGDVCKGDLYRVPGMEDNVRVSDTVPYLLCALWQCETCTDW